MDLCCLTINDPKEVTKGILIKSADCIKLRRPFNVPSGKAAIQRDLERWGGEGKGKAYLVQFSKDRLCTWEGRIS